MKQTHHPLCSLYFPLALAGLSALASLTAPCSGRTLGRSVFSALDSPSRPPLKIHYKPGYVPTEDSTLSPRGTPGQKTIKWPFTEAGELQYRGGPLMTEPITVHLVYYGKWDTEDSIPIEGFIRSLSSDESDDKGPSVHKWWGIVTRYTDSDDRNVSSQVSMGERVFIKNNYKKSLDNAGIERVVLQQIQKGSFPEDANAIYVVLTSADVAVKDGSDGMCTTYCGWHTSTSLGNTLIKYALVGDGSRCSCGTNLGLSATANGNFKADSLISTLAHELAETATDPDTQGGYLAEDASSNTMWENADLCGDELTDAEHPDVLYTQDKSAAFNLYGVDDLRFLVQTNVDIAKQECVLQAKGLSGGGGISEGPDSGPIAPPPEDGGAWPPASTPSGDGGDTSGPEGQTFPPSEAQAPEGCDEK